MIYEYAITGKNYHTLDYYLKTKYKKKVFKVPLNASFTCPNRDGSKSTNGCKFCSLLGSGDFAGNPHDDILSQFETIKNRQLKKWPDAYYIAYFQAYSNTYGSIEKMKQYFEPFINKENVIGMSIATRPDCINKEVAEYLSSLKAHFKEFWVEFGLQSSKKQTMKSMNLCYSYKDFKTAVAILRDYNIDVVVHIINGLPNETLKDNIKTIKDVNKCDVQGIKIHCLNIIKNSLLGKQYLKKPFKVLSYEQYVLTVCLQIAHLKDNVIIHRLGADSNASDLIAPLWVSNKLSLMDSIDTYLNENDIFQADNVNS